MRPVSSLYAMCAKGIAAIALLLTVQASPCFAAPPQPEHRPHSTEIGFSLGLEFGRWGLVGGSGTEPRTWIAAAVTVATKNTLAGSRATFDFGFAVQADTIGEYGMRMFDTRIGWERFLFDEIKGTIHWSFVLGGSVGLEILRFGLTSGRFVRFGVHLGTRVYLFERWFLETGAGFHFGVSLTTLNDSYAWHIPLMIGTRFP